MVESITKVATGSISNRVDAYNIKNGLTLSNMQFFGTDCVTRQHKEYKEIQDPRITALTLGDYGLGGMSFNSQRLANTLKPRIEEALLRSEEKAVENGNTIKTIYMSLYPTGTSASVSPIVAAASRARGLNCIIFAVIPDTLSESYQHLNCIYSTALSSFFPVILVNEGFAESTCLSTRIQARNAAGMDHPSKFYITAQYSINFCNKLARLISGLPENKDNKNSMDEEDDLGFLDAEDTNHRNQSVELETAIGGRQELFTMYYGHSENNNFEELAVLRPSVMPSSEPGDPLIFVEYNISQISEDEVGNAIIASLEMQTLRPERIFYIPSTKNSIVALIPCGIPSKLKELIRFIKKDKPLNEVMEKVCKKTILSNIPPIHRGYENRILKERMSKIFYPEKSDIEMLAKTLGFSMDWDELIERNLLFHLAEEGVYLRPIGQKEEEE